MTFTLDTQDNWPDSLDQTEAKVLNKLVTSILDAGYSLRIRDEENELSADTTRNRAAIQAATAQTGMTFYDVMREAGLQDGPRSAYLGTLVLIHGIGPDLVLGRHGPKDKPENETLLDALAKPAVDYAETLLN